MKKESLKNGSILRGLFRVIQGVYRPGSRASRHLRRCAVRGVRNI